VHGSHSFPWSSSNAARSLSPSSGLTTCLEDETAIDFPAVLRVADGARRLFVDEAGDDSGPLGSGDEVLTTVELPRGATVAGAVVSCDIVLRDICTSCGGRGESWCAPCQGCAAEGHVAIRRRVRLAVPPGVRDGARYQFRLSRANQSSVTVDVRIIIH
jgi:hypothetical protein